MVRRLSVDLTFKALSTDSLVNEMDISICIFRRRYDMSRLSYWKLSIAEPEAADFSSSQKAASLSSQDIFTLWIYTDFCHDIPWAINWLSGSWRLAPSKNAPVPFALPVLPMLGTPQCCG